MRIDGSFFKIATDGVAFPSARLDFENVLVLNSFTTLSDGSLLQPPHVP